MIQKILKERELPDLLAGADAESWPMRRKEILNILSENVYGVTPVFDTEPYSFIEARDENAYGGTAIQEWVRLSFQTPGGMYSFPFQLLIPKKEEPVPAFVHLSFQQRELNPLGVASLREPMPGEEILSEGYAVANLFYESITSDRCVKDGLAMAYPGDGGNGWGKIGMWAFAASRVLDYLLSRKEIDNSRIAVGGWSRLGKTALWCGAQDERFSAVFSTESGCSGAALQRGKAGEQIEDIVGRFDYWFCPNYGKYRGREKEMPFDQHFLLACIAPRPLFIGSAKEDEWADPLSEFLGAAAASEAYRLLGGRGLEVPKQWTDAESGIRLEPDRLLADGEIGYFMRRGTHGMSRMDWLAQLRFREIHRV